MNPISVAITTDAQGVASAAYVGNSLQDARNALAGAVTPGSQTTGYILQQPVPTEIIHSDEIPVDPPPEGYMQPPIYDIESAIGLAKLPDGRTVIAGDEKRSEEMAPTLEKDISGQQLDEATAQLRAEHEDKAHAFTRAGLEERSKAALEQQQAIEDDYAKTAGIPARKVDSDYSEAEHVAKQRADEAARADEALQAAGAEPHNEEHKKAKHHKKHKEE